MEYVLFDDGYIVVVEDTLDYKQIHEILVTVKGALEYYWLDPGRGWHRLTSDSTSSLRAYDSIEPPEIIKLVHMLG
ncbi:hypothetical protein HOT57_gp28 [Pseudomonas phage phCDa]|uniref:Uncharacterized protein n=1 Tax=Pseudomonas phage phCDa TaxID=2268587 RepID=A0A2Z5HAD3_9CAUD|nr:hypothetical protein HOT57_gp28 [Pseudomonas phage phCDa]AXC36472.1 hypothetical protein phCDa_28 [Pseudomonas phage phCDa]